MIDGEHVLAHSSHNIVIIYDKRHQHGYINTLIDATCKFISGQRTRRITWPS